jgi:hypothetical protein
MTAKGIVIQKKKASSVTSDSSTVLPVLLLVIVLIRRGLPANLNSLSLNAVNGWQFQMRKRIGFD